VAEGRITRSQAKKHESEQISSLAIEEFSDDAKMSLEKDLTSRSDDSDRCEVAISAKPTTDRRMAAERSSSAWLHTVRQTP
jgi:hypothetical protein